MMIMATAPRTLDYDVVVLGGGGSGLAAAIEAAIAGARVVVLEKAEILRGSTARSVGAISASRTPDQKRLGISDSPELHFEDYRKLSGELAVDESEELARLLVDNVTESLAWLRGLGVEFFGPVEGAGHSVPRLHNALPGSRSYIHHLHKRARRLGVAILLRTTAEALEQVGDSVNQVRAQSGDGSQVLVTARRAVVLTTGDFSASAEMKSKYISERVAAFLPVNPHATGDAQRMAIAVGAQMLNADIFDMPSMRLAPPPAEGWFGLLQKLPPGRPLTMPIKWGLRHIPGRLIRPLMLSFVTTYLSPREALFDNGAILIDRHGQWHSGGEESTSLTIAELGEDGGYIVGDQRLFEQFSTGENFVAMAPGVARAYMPDFRRSRKDVYAEADSLTELATKIGVSEDTLQTSVEQANSANAERRLRRLEIAPYFALGPVRAHLIQTNGGLKVSPRMEVLTESGDPIPGLFAAGNAGQGGLALFGYGHHLGWAFTSGRIAGRNAAQTRPSGPVADRL
jgi:succinate dehydrogenase/fumarate reductase flavoprotein subunit